MGVFGPGIFADDDALDVRSEYKFYLADAQSDEGATDAIAKQYAASFEDPSTTTGFWLGLAWTQWTMGRLDPRVKAVALRIIDEKLDLKKWEGSKLEKKRADALQKARVKIESPQPKTRPMPKPLAVQLPGWQFAEVIGVRMPEGQLALLHMITYRKCSRHGVKAPVVSILNWTKADLPTAEEVQTLSYINWRRYTCGNHLLNLAAPKRSPRPPEQFLHLGITKPVTRPEAASAYGSINTDETLEGVLTQYLLPYWENPQLPPIHPGWDKPEAEMFRQAWKKPGYGPS